MSLRSRDAWPRWARNATSPWLLSPLLVIALVVGGFTAYGAWTRAHPTHYSRGGDAFGVDSLLTSPSASPQTAKKAAGRKGKKTTAGVSTAKSKANKPSKKAAVRSGGSSSGASSSGGSTSGGSTSGGSTSGGSTSGGSTSTAPAVPATGTYTLAVDGSESV